MNQARGNQGFARPSEEELPEEELRTIITDPDGAETLVQWADRIGKGLKDRGLTTSQIRALFGEVRQIQAEWTIQRARALRRLILLKPKMAYRARKKQVRGSAVCNLVNVLQPALDLVINAEPKVQSEDNPNNQDDNYQRFVEFFEAILAYHKAYGGD